MLQQQRQQLLAQQGRGMYAQNVAPRVWNEPAPDLAAAANPWFRNVPGHQMSPVATPVAQIPEHAPVFDHVYP